MDPDANLREQEELLCEMAEYEADGTTHHPAYDNARDELYELRKALSYWLGYRGFEPNWDAAPRARIHFGR